MTPQTSHSSTAQTDTETSTRTAPNLHAASRAASGAGRGDAAAHLTAIGISKRYGERRVLTDVSFTARAGDRIGLIGENGTGKSTLLRILAGVEQPDAGAVSHAADVALLEQELPYPDDAPLGRVLDDAQRTAFDALAAIESAGEAFAEQPDDPSVAAAYAEALEEAERTGAWQAEARRGATLIGLGLGGFGPTRTVGALSGGQRLRLALAALLLRAPHTLLLDEPSNHLDDAAAAYLERVLSSWPGIVIVASHDRALLDAITTRVLDLDASAVPATVLADAAAPALPAAQAHPAPAAPAAPAASPSWGAKATIDAGRVVALAPHDDARESSDGAPTTEDVGSGLGVRAWGVGYSAARAERAREMRRWRERYAAELEEREALVHEIEVGSREVNRKHESKSEAKITRKFYADKDARVTARRARNARVRLEALERERVRRPPEPLRFRGFAAAAATTPITTSASASAAPTSAQPGRDGSAPAAEPVLRAERLALPGRLGTISLALEPGGRLLLAGPNGAGKSTLLALLAGADPSPAFAAATGTIERGARIGYLPQEVVFARPERTATEAYRDAVGAGLAEAAPLASTGLLAARDLDRPISALSIGQRRRVALAALVADPPPVLLLDEPTNHLSLTLVEELEEALESFDGSLVIATHDRYLRRAWTGEVLELRPVEV